MLPGLYINSLPLNIQAETHLSEQHRPATLGRFGDSAPSYKCTHLFTYLLPYGVINVIIKRKLASGRSTISERRGEIKG